jgi:hypothetical protein
MENEELFANEPEVDAQVRAGEPSQRVTENTRLLSESDAISHQQPFYLTDTRPQWRRPSVSGDSKPKTTRFNIPVDLVAASLRATVHAGFRRTCRSKD